MVARHGGYELAPGRVWIDADDFEAHARAGPGRRSQRGAPERAEAALGEAADAYQGDFLADEPYAEWALPERERLRDLAGQVLRGARRPRGAPPTTRMAPASTSSASPSSSRSTSARSAT